MSINQQKDATLDDLAREFIVTNEDYYQRAFAKIQSSKGFVWSWNSMAALFGPLWGALRGVWGYFWIFLILELFALVQIGRGLWGELGGDNLERYERLMINIVKRQDQATALQLAGDYEGAAAKLKIASNLQTAADKALLAAEDAAAQASGIALGGLLLFVFVKILEGFYANIAYERQYLSWR